MTEKEYFIKCGIGEAYHGLSLSSFAGDPAAKEEVEAYLKRLKHMRELGYGIFAYGENGNGKTTLMCEVLKTASRQQNPKTRQAYTIFKTSLSEMVTAMTKGWYDDASRLAFERTILDKDFLLIDDVEKGIVGENTNLQRHALDMVLRKRIERLRPILMTSNETPAALSQIFGKSIGSLLAGYMICVEFEPGDYRKQHSANKAWKEIKRCSME